MTLKQYIQLFVPPVYYKVRKRLFQNKQPQINPLPKVELSGKPMVIIGNGPSLNKTVELYKQQLLRADCVMVNFSACTPLYETIKPCFYIMTDPRWVTATGEKLESMEKCINTIVEKTIWPMTMVLPNSFRTWWAIDKLLSNKNITIWFDESEWIKLPEDELFKAFDKNRVCPPSYTVLTYCLYLSLYWGYKETYLVGADTTFTQMVYVGQKDNVVYTVDTHFYNNDEVNPLTKDVEHNGRPFGMNMEEYTEMCYTIFYEYNLLARYAKWKGVKVYNASEYSMIDCFDRKKLI